MYSIKNEINKQNILLMKRNIKAFHKEPDLQKQHVTTVTEMFSAGNIQNVKSPLILVWNS